MSQSESRRVAHCMYVEIELKKKKKNFDFESLVLRKFRKITAISHPCHCEWRKAAQKTMSIDHQEVSDSSPGMASHHVLSTDYLYLAHHHKECHTAQPRRLNVCQHGTSPLRLLGCLKKKKSHNFIFHYYKLGLLYFQLAKPQGCGHLPNLIIPIKEARANLLYWLWLTDFWKNPPSLVYSLHSLFPVSLCNFSTPLLAEQ